MWLAGSRPLFCFPKQREPPRPQPAVWKHLLSNKLNSSEDHLAEDSFNKLLWNYCDHKGSLDSRSDICFVMIRLLQCICLPGYSWALFSSYPPNYPNKTTQTKVSQQENWGLDLRSIKMETNLISPEPETRAALRLASQVSFSCLGVIYFQVSYISFG